METWNRMYWVRHGENLANLTLEFSHRKVDYSLTPRGVLQAEQTAVYLRDKGVQEIYSSPLKRAAETAAAIGIETGLPVTCLEMFREVNVGDLEGQEPTRERWGQHNAIIHAWQNGQPDVRFPGGEDFHGLVARMMDGLRTSLSGKSGRTIVIVAHGGLFSFTLPVICAGLTPDAIDRPMGNCSITELRARLDGNGVEAQLIRFADTSHLSGEAAKLVLGLPE